MRQSFWPHQVNLVTTGFVALNLECHFFVYMKYPFPQGLCNHARSFVRNVEGIRKRNFFLAGLFVALSLANGGQGFDCPSEAVYSSLCYGLCSGKTISNIRAIANDLIREHLLKVCYYNYVH